MEGNKPLVDIYSSYSKDGAAFYNAGNFNDALTNFKSSLDVFELMSSKKMIPLKLDTTTTLYAGISAEKANKPDTAAFYYSKIAENKAKAEGFVEIYKWLADHYRQKKDTANATKFATLGREVYPEETFWSGFELDMAREKGSKDQLFSKYEQVIKENPDNHLFYFNYGVELYQAGYNQDSTKRPANSLDLIERARQQIAKSIEKKGDYANSQMLMGQILYNQGVDINNKNKTIRPPQGGKLKPEELKKKEDLRVEMNKKFDEALTYFGKVDQILGSQAKLKLDDKNILKDAYDLTITIYEQKQNADKVTEFTTKFNDVDKKH
jgi:tetratricopeptide (TPR) repeat protein